MDKRGIKYKVTYKTKVFIQNGFLEPDGFSSVVFFNQGTDTAYILNDLKIEQDEDRVFINREFDEIAQNINIRFDTVVAPRVVALMIYYNDIT